MSWLQRVRQSFGFGPQPMAEAPSEGLVRALPQASPDEVVTPFASRVVVDARLWSESRIAGAKTPAQLSAIISEANGGNVRGLIDVANDARQKDCHLQAVLAQSEESIAALEWQLILHEDALARDVRAAEWVEQVLRQVPSFRRIIGHLAGAVYYGHAVSEIMWAVDAGRIVPVEFVAIQPRRFGYRVDDARFVLQEEFAGPNSGIDFRADFPGKFIVSQPRVNGDAPHREGLARPLLWAALFRNWTLTDWLRTGEISWKPWRIGKFDKKVSTKEDVDGLYRMLERMSTSGIGVLPENVSLDVKWAANGTSGANSTHAALSDMLAREMSKAVLGQTETTQSSQSSGYAQAKVHQGVQGQLIESRARAIAADITRDLIGTMIALNFGPKVAVPSLNFVTQDPLDFSAFSTGVKALKEAGVRIPQSWVRDQAGIPEPAEGEEIVGENMPTVEAPGDEDNDDEDGEDDDEESDAEKPKDADGKA